MMSRAIVVAVFMLAGTMAAAESPATDVAVPRDCDPADANAADAGCKALDPHGGAAVPQSDSNGRHGTCETMDGKKVEWSQPNVPFGVARCEPTDAAPKPQGK